MFYKERGLSIEESVKLHTGFFQTCLAWTCIFFSFGAQKGFYGVNLKHKLTECHIVYIYINQRVGLHSLDKCFDNQSSSYQSFVKSAEFFVFLIFFYFCHVF